MNVLITGGHGFLGSAVRAALSEYSLNVRSLGRADGDLCSAATAEKLLHGADTVIHLAADVGGVGYLRSCAGRSFHANFRLGLNVIRAACRTGVQRLILASTPCAYSGDAQLPLREEALDEGVPSGDTGNYGYAKMASTLVANQFCLEAGIDTVTVIPSNLYGPGDNFDSEKGHVVAALVRKALIAHELGQKSFGVWGDGAATRDFVYVHDVARAIARITLAEERYDGTIYNLGSGQETSIRQIAIAVGQAVSPKLHPEFDESKPVGYSRRVMSIERARHELQYEPSTSLTQGLRETVHWLRSHGIVDKWLQQGQTKAA